MGNCKSCGRKRELVCCNECYFEYLTNKLHYIFKTNEAQDINKIRLDISELLNSVNKIKESLIELKIKELKVK